MKKIVSTTLLSLPMFTALVAHAVEGGHAEAPHAVPTNVWFHFINFGILAFLLYRWLRAPIRNYLVKRSDSIRDALEKAEAARLEAEATSRQYAERLARLDQEIAAFRKETEDAAREESEKIVANAKAAAERLENDTRRLMNDELNKARYQLRQEAIDLAIQLAQGMLTSRMTDADQRRLAEEYLQRVGQATEIH